MSITLLCASLLFYFITVIFEMKAKPDSRAALMFANSMRRGESFEINSNLIEGINYFV